MTYGNYLRMCRDEVFMILSILESFLIVPVFSTQYDIVGHSGDGYDIELVPADKMPKNDKQRLKVLKVHTLNQFSCVKYL